MHKFIFLFLSGALISSNAIGSTCPSHLRVAHGHAFEDRPIEVVLNGKTLVSELKFREVAHYQRIKPGKVSIEFFERGTGRSLGKRNLVLGSGQAYTVILAGPAQGVPGMLFSNESPFVFLDDITPTSPGRWKGHWYRMSETQVTIDFRISDGNNPEKEISRLINKPNRASYQLADLPTGVFQFNPVMPGKSEPFFNAALTPPANVELRNITMNDRESIDIFAFGNFLGRAPNSLQLTYQKYRTTVSPNGCMKIENL
ncbi:MAG: DUF4397 domain-containing protein [Bdellovibrionales bacterium]|nr:DUF4397 domain-containing protein [Bdellovibrionales bacterium]